MKKVLLILASVLIMGMTMAQQGNHWSPIPGTQYSMTVKGIIVIDGVVQSNNMLEIGAFCGDECRGSRKASLFPPTGDYIVTLNIVSNVVSGEIITFRIYDHSIQQELVLESLSTLTFVDNSNAGDPTNWFQIAFATPSVTYTLPITGYGNNTGNYYLIAPPIDNVDPSEIEGMTTGDFDLYYFDQSEELEWRNYKVNPFNLESGKGYLYAHKTNVTLTFTGMPYNGDGKVTLRKTGGLSFEGWNLVGNPFPQVATIDRDCYVMNANGTEIIASKTRIVNPMQGVFVMAASDNEKMTFVPQGNTDTRAKIVLNVYKQRASTIDRAIIRFEGNSTLPKLMLDPDNTKLYIPQDGTDYAVAVVGNNGITPVSFKAQEDGTYTLSVDVTSLDLDYLHLFDNKTGTDVDLLQVPSYTFDAQTTDYAERFNLTYATTTGVSEGDKPFAYYADGEIHLLVETFQETSLQIVDMQGRVIMVCRDGVHTISTSGMPSGIYVLRLVNGTETKAQKIIIE
ncbi:MAG: T9SS type A sorting domain-containing protein [Bacteroidales bacterium]|nr:T9SS type A sorting domain-containing protein [Bacteroidales bacterium]